MDVILAYMQYRSTVYARFSVFDVSQFFFFLNLINHIRTLHQSFDRYTRQAFELLFGDNDFFSV